MHLSWPNTLAPPHHWLRIGQAKKPPNWKACCLIWVGSPKRHWNQGEISMILSISSVSLKCRDIVATSIFNFHVFVREGAPRSRFWNAFIIEWSQPKYFQLFWSHDPALQYFLVVLRSSMRIPSKKLNQVWWRRRSHFVTSSAYSQLEIFICLIFSSRKWPSMTLILVITRTDLS